MAILSQYSFTTALYTTECNFKMLERKSFFYQKIRIIITSTRNLFFYVRKYLPTLHRQGAKLLAFRLSGTPRNTVGKPIILQGFPTGKPVKIKFLVR